MKSLIAAITFIGMAFQFLRPVDPAIYAPRYITGFGVFRVRIFRVVKFYLALIVAVAILALFGFSFN